MKTCKRMAFYPFTAVDEPPQGAQRPTYNDSERVLYGMAGTHLISDRTYAADTCGDVWHLAVVASTQQGFKEARRLEDLEFDIDHPAFSDPYVQ